MMSLVSSLLDLSGTCWLTERDAERLHSFTEALVDAVLQYPATLNLLRPQFPRQSIIALLKYVEKHHDIPISSNQDEAPKRTVSMFEAWMELEQLCVIVGQCSRRGCKRRLHKRCKRCRDACYCGKECQVA